jgi:dihydrofolate reductase (trimethoprim resistance protein)
MTTDLIEKLKERGANDDLVLLASDTIAMLSMNKTFKMGDRVRKKSGSQWKVVGYYKTKLTPEGYAVESDTEKGSVQIYPVHALERI